jgi:hypothetical protein
MIAGLIDPPILFAAAARCVNCQPDPVVELAIAIERAEVCHRSTPIGFIYRKRGMAYIVCMARSNLANSRYTSYNTMRYDLCQPIRAVYNGNYHYYLWSYFLLSSSAFSTRSEGMWLQPQQACCSEALLL